MVSRMLSPVENQQDDCISMPAQYNIISALRIWNRVHTAGCHGVQGGSTLLIQSTACIIIIISHDARLCIPASLDQASKPQQINDAEDCEDGKKGCRDNQLSGQLMIAIHLVSHDIA